MVLITMIDDATSRILSRFYPGDTVEAHFDLLGRWIKKFGRPLALYTDRQRQSNQYASHTRRRALGM
jgi:hypothetical protein